MGKQNEIKKITLREKMFLMTLGFCLTFIIIELGLRLGGFLFLTIQEYRNKSSLRKAGQYCILCFGESTTAMGEHPYPEQLEEILNQRMPGVRFSVINKGVPGTNTSGILLALEQNLNKYKPNMVVAMMGINDAEILVPNQNNFAYCLRNLLMSMRTYKLLSMLKLHIMAKMKEKGWLPAGINGHMAQIKQGSFADIGHAKEILRYALAQNPRDDQAYLEYGQVCKVQGESTQAENAFKKVLELNPYNSTATSELAWLYYSQGKTAQAEVVFLKSLDLDHKTDRAYTELARFYWIEHKVVKAKEACLKALALNPKSYQAYIEYGRVSKDEGKVAQAEEAFKKALDLDAKDEAAYDGLKWIYKETGKKVELEELFKKALKNNVRGEWIYAELAWFYQEEGRFSEAEDAFKKAIALNPDNYWVQINLAGFYLDRGRLADAEETLKKAVRMHPQSEKVVGTIATFYKKYGKNTLMQYYYDQANNVRLKYYNPITVSNYRLLREILDKRNIVLVCVQYPMRNIEPLKKIFERQNGIIFVDNEKIFKDAVQKMTYNDYFSDAFGGDFGHCRDRGNRLLAENIANGILEYLKK